MFRLLFSLTLSAGAAVALHAQPTFRSTVDLVTIPVTVGATDRSRVRELHAADFRIYEDGVLQDIALVTREPRPVSICILLDSSPSMAPRQSIAIRAIETVFKELESDDEVAILMFASKTRVALPWTPVPEARSFSWYGWRLSLGTALIDAMKEALGFVEKASNPVPIVLIVSDGADTLSSTPLAKLVASRRQSETMVYGMHTEGRPTRTPIPLNKAFLDTLPDIVGDSGGTIYRARDPDAAEAAAFSFVEELRSQYTLGYAPKKLMDGKFRQVKVETTNPGLVVRHRAGYLAQPR